MTSTTSSRFFLGGSFALVLLWAGYVCAEDKVLGSATPDQALVYVIQSEGETQQVFAERRWLGVVHPDSYAFYRLDPGEYLFWSGAGAYELMFVGSGNTYYFRLDGQRLEAVAETQGRSLLDSVGDYSTTSAEDPELARKDLANYSEVRTGALFLGVYKPCRFVDEKMAEDKKRAAGGDSDAQLRLGALFWLNECVERDTEVAIGWYTMAAKSGEVNAARALGDIYRSGVGVDRDDKRAVEWYLQAAEAGHLKAQRQLADMYHYGAGVERNMETAKVWYKRAVEEHEDPWAANRLRKIDKNQPDLARRRQLRKEAKTRAEAEDKEQARLRRLARLEDRFGKLLVAVSPFEGQAKIEVPRRKKLVENDVPGGTSTGNGSGIEYMLPPELLLGAIAVYMVYDVIDSSLKKRLSEEEKLEVDSATETLNRVFQEQSVVLGMRQKIVESGLKKEGLSVYTPVEYKPSELGPERYSDVTSTGRNLLLEVETTGIGLVLAEKRYRPTRFAMATDIRLVDAHDGAMLRQKSLCYVSRDAPLFAKWAENRGGMVSAEIDSAFVAVAEEIQVMLAQPSGAEVTESNVLCEKLREPAQQESTLSDETRSR